MGVAAAVTVAVTFVWVGMLVGISFLETPLKFRAPGVTTRIGLGIGRLVFRALNRVEVMLAVAVVIGLALGPATAVPVITLGLAVAVLAGQLIFVRPRLNRRTDAVLAGEDRQRSRTHLVYVGLEVAKLLALLIGGIALLVHV